MCVCCQTRCCCSFSNLFLCYKAGAGRRQTFEQSCPRDFRQSKIRLHNTTNYTKTQTATTKMYALIPKNTCKVLWNWNGRVNKSVTDALASQPPMRQRKVNFARKFVEKVGFERKSFNWILKGLHKPQNETWNAAKRYRDKSSRRTLITVFSFGVCGVLASVCWCRLWSHSSA